MFRRIGTVMLAFATLALLLAVAFARTDTPRLEPEALKPQQRPAAVFDHDAHNEKAKLENCAVCHHDAKDGKIVPEGSSEGTPCADCHAKAATKGTYLVNAYHRQCMDCHKTSGKGPTSCGGCHVRD